ncbi:hypothetical protein HPB47_023739 [Ixodes persulcatus]|uniref:Uncharacterized protein n=1 Tax=Ixodes persulcatus TaxID=34615 RepID=A0AC60Q8F6_IXOPE|nr:hypothetical protein HPB47_023739 [Ixodes persulcatus]
MTESDSKLDPSESSLACAGLQAGWKTGILATPPRPPLLAGGSADSADSAPGAGALARGSVGLVSRASFCHWESGAERGRRGWALGQPLALTQSLGELGQHVASTDPLPRRGESWWQPLVPHEEASPDACILAARSRCLVIGSATKLRGPPRAASSMLLLLVVFGTGVSGILGTAFGEDGHGRCLRWAREFARNQHAETSPSEPKLGGTWVSQGETLDDTLWSSEATFATFGPWGRWRGREARVPGDLSVPRAQKSAVRSAMIYELESDVDLDYQRNSEDVSEDEESISHMHGDGQAIRARTVRTIRQTDRPPDKI